MYFSLKIFIKKKAPALVYHLLLIDAWKTNVYPLIAKDLAANDSVKTYFLVRAHNEYD